MLLLLLFTTCVHVVYCQRCKIIIGRLKKADCRKIHLKKIPQNLSEDIDVLDLGEISFVTILNESFSHYSNLKVLKLDTCNIESVEAEAFKGLWKLEILSLANNSLNISTNDGLFILRNIPNIIDLDFSSNMELADKTGHLLYPGAAFQHLKKLQNLTIDLYGCPVLGHEFKNLLLKWRIIFFCYRKFRGIVENSLKLNYDYNVFISYGYDGYSWVLETLVEQLETKWGFRVCVEDKNITSGRSTFKQIGIALNRSRQIIFVVTSDFLSKLCPAYEIDRTKEARSSRSLQNIIVIALDINIEDIPQELQSLWSDVVVIEWHRHSIDVNLALDNLKTRLLLNC
ncbi:unnamed protein product [Mytilus coruscus]|uniref:TIR domain-containing protein n=1 Tax=Mytilus coruscus TaxID=42192 RepID=A0A6J8AHE9_MYTCO|nr:unnamed protein product [Mytilus coruscus]